MTAAATVATQQQTLWFVPEEENTLFKNQTTFRNVLQEN